MWQKFLTIFQNLYIFVLSHHLFHFQTSLTTSLIAVTSSAWLSVPALGCGTCWKRWGQTPYYISFAMPFVFWEYVHVLMHETHDCYAHAFHPCSSIGLPTTCLVWPSPSMVWSSCSSTKWALVASCWEDSSSMTSSGCLAQMSWSQSPSRSRPQSNVSENC